MRTSVFAVLFSLPLLSGFAVASSQEALPARGFQAVDDQRSNSRYAKLSVRRDPSPDVSVLASPSGGSPNLRPFTPPAWSAPLVVSTIPGTNSDSSPLNSAIYLDWAVINSGAGTVNTPFNVRVTMDGTLVRDFPIDPVANPDFVLEPGFFLVLEDLFLGELSPGSHSLALVVDSAGQVSESDENDNQFSRVINVTGTPNLRPFQPNGWSAPIVISTVTGGRTDSAPLTSEDTLYIDWAVVNDGGATINQTYFTTLFVDGVQVGTWFTDPPHEPGNFVFVSDYPIGPLTPGEHTFRLLTDSRSQIAESNEPDNSFQRQVTVQAPEPTDEDTLPLVFPSIQGGTGLDTGVALANPTQEPAEVDLILFDSNDVPVANTTIEIAPDTQIARTLTELFGPAGASVDGWMLAFSRNLGVVGFFLTFTEGARNIDGAEAANRGAGTVVFPEILTGGGLFTEISLIGAGNVTLELRRANGSLVESRNMSLPATEIGRLKSRVDQLFTQAIPVDAYVLARADQFNVFGYETFGGPNYLAGRNAIPVSESANLTPTSLFGAQLADVPALQSVITVVNPTDTAATLTFQAFRTGTPSGQPAATETVVLGPRQLLKSRARDLIGLPDGDFVGWLRIDSDNAGVVGDVTFGDNQNYLASVQLQDTPTSDLVFSHVADGLGFFTGITFLNVRNDPSTVSVEVFNVAGVRTGQASFTLAGFEHRPQVLSQIIPGFPAQVGGYIKVHADPGIFSFELFSLLGSGNQLLSLAAVPPQRGSGIVAGQIQAGINAAGLARSTYPASRSKGVALDATADFVPGEVVVQFRPDRDASVDRIASKIGLKVMEHGGDGAFLARSTRQRVVSLGRLKETAKSELDSLKLQTLLMIERLNAEPDVLYAEPNYIYQAFRTPNDPGYVPQWHYPAINLPAAWDITIGDPNLIVAVIDTGAKFGHPQLGPRLTGGQYDFISDPQNALDGDGIDPSAEDPGDDPRGLASSYHGTHVAGTVGAVTNDGLGVAGVNWSSRLMTLRVLGAGGGSNFDIAQAIRYAARLGNSSGTLPTQRANVINMSLGGPSDSLTLAAAISAALNQNVVIVAAAGNENSSAASFPASYPGVVSVGAIDLSGGKAPYSNFGDRIDVVAPGGNTAEDRNGDGFPDGVLSTLWNQASDTPTFAFYQGTSMASPHVAGLASLILSVNPNLNPFQVRQILQSTAIDLGLPGRDNTYGNGLVDALAALRSAGNLGGGATPILRLATNRLDFGASATQLQVPFSNVGGGTLQVSSPTVELDTGAGWLGAQLSGSTVVVQVNRQGLGAGAYSGRVRLASNGGAGVIEVEMQVGGGGVANVGSIFVLALNPSTFETVAVAEAVAASDYAFRTGAVPAGEYLIVAGTDNDEDGFICDDGEFCGFYPVTNQPETVTVVANQVLSGVSFTVEQDQFQQNSERTGLPKGFRILRQSPIRDPRR